MTPEEMEGYWKKVQVESARILTKLGLAHAPGGFSVGLGWMPIVEEGLTSMLAAGWDGDLAQIKQKFCGLRIYTGKHPSDEVRVLIGKAEARARDTCEICGKEREKKGERIGRATCNACELE